MTGRSASIAAILAVVGALAMTAKASERGIDAAPQAQYRGLQVAGLFGESDEEKAARQQHEDNQDTLIADLKQRVHDLEQSLQQATGQNEQLGHQLHDLSDRLDHQQIDYDYKLCALSAQLLGTSPAAGQSGDTLPCNFGNSNVGAGPPSQSVPLSNSGNVIGTLSTNEAAAPMPVRNSMRR